MALPEDYAEPKRLQNNNNGKGVNGNLIPPVKGEVRNPAGRPVGSRNRSTIAKEWLSVIGELDGQKLPYEDLITLAAIKKALTGDVAAYNALNDNAYGKLTDKQELTGRDGEPLQAIVRKVVDPKNNENS